MKRRLLGAPSIVILLLCFMYFITYVDRLNVATAAPLIRKELGLSLTQMGFVFAVFGYPYAVFQIIGGHLCDRFGAGRTLTVCGLLWAIATLLTGLVGGLVSLVLVRVLLGVGEGATFPTANRALQSWVAENRRGWAQGVTHAFARAGSAVTPPLVVALMATAGWRGGFALLGLASMCWVAVWALYFRDEPSAHPGVTREELSALPAARARGSNTPTPWRLLVRRIAPVTFTYFCYGWTLWLYLYWLPSFFKEGQKLDLKSTALYTFAVFGSGVIGDILGGLLSDAILRRTGNVLLARRLVVVLAYLGTIAALVPVVYLRSLLPVTICLSLGFFFLELAIGPMWAVPMDIAPKFSGTASGLMNFGSAVAAIISPVVFGKVVDLTGNWHLPFWGSVGLLGVGCVSSLFMRPDRPLAATPKPQHLEAATPSQAAS